MAKNKTTEAVNSVTDFINSINDEVKRKDSFHLIEIIKSEMGFDAKMWGPSIVGFGSYHYKYQSGHEGDAPLVGFSPRATAIVLYLTQCFDMKDELLKKLGKHKTGKGCIYIKKLDDINMDVLKEMISASAQHLQKNYQQ
jgi:hypothetical protein